MIQDVNAKETARTSSATEARHIQDLDARIQALDRRIRQVCSRRRQTGGSTSQNLSAEQTNLR